ncbi:oxysterol-binding protein-related protein 3-like [Scleropages formosus]|uniref:Oxysterol-binding protein-related protein 3-like n=1 Tax=Scleropages formosus TaxID=113540 RepID=A0A0P7WSF7_SCLFO|nr:oxysterol-binding protein-related protein 3-like [Scleropages formosus]
MAQKKPSPSHSDSSSSSRHGSRQDSWEIVEGVRGELTNEKEPEKHKGFLLKKRKWPMKGWHKRYFFLEKGILKYAKSATDILKGKLHGCIDVGLSVMSINEKSMCIDLDTEENIYHLKVKSQELFEEWVSKLRHHRIYRQNEIAMYPHERAFIFSQCAPSASPSLPQGAPCRKCGTRMRQSSGHPAAGFLMTFSPQAKLQLSEDMEKCTGELLSCESYLLDLQHLLRSMEVLHRTCSAPAISPIPVHQASTFNSSPKKEKRSHRKWRSKNYSKDAKMTLQDSYDGPHPLVHQTSNGSRTSIPDSLSEFVDAQEVLLSSSSSENEVSDDDSYASDVSDYLSTPAEIHEVEKTTLTLGTHSLFSSTLHAESQGCVENGPLPRRSCLPSPSSSSSISLWNILKNNIGKDLSKVTMPVVLNEPLNTLQRLCEELEYSELLDKAASTVDPFERMVYVATFAISGYASSCYRAGAKPFNPVLGETYECIRPEKGFRFIAEQQRDDYSVTAGQPSSSCFGMPFRVPELHLLARFGDHYEWNKVTSCIHNILNGQRWIEHYGEISIKNSSSDICQCKITFLKTKHWNSVVNEVEGVITDQTGRVMHKLFGKWNEAIYCGEPPSATCIWKANAMPADYEQYYGFTKFAMELNELDPELKPLLPPTDTRFRIDQRALIRLLARLLEEGNVEAAEEQKRRIEQLQRERQHVLEEKNMTLQPRFFK